MLQLSPYFVIHNFAHFSAKSAFHSLNVSPELLLQHVPVGTDSESAVAALSKESFDCKTSRWPSDENSRKLRGVEQVEMNGALLSCQLLAPERLGYTHWLIDLRFDEGKRLLGVTVAIWIIFL